MTFKLLRRNYWQSDCGGYYVKACSMSNSNWMRYRAYRRDGTDLGSHENKSNAYALCEADKASRGTVAA